VASALPTPSGIELDNLKVDGIPKITEAFVASYQDQNGPAKFLIDALGSLRSKAELVDESALVSAVTARLSTNQPPLSTTHVVRSIEILMFAIGNPQSTVSAAAQEGLKGLYESGALHGLVKADANSPEMLSAMIGCFLKIDKFKF